MLHMHARYKYTGCHYDADWSQPFINLQLLAFKIPVTSLKALLIQQQKYFYGAGSY